MEASLPNLIAKAENVSGLKLTEVQDHHCVINSKKVTDHHAIIPTASVDKADLSELPNGEREILKIIATRLLEAVSSPCIYAEAVLEGECEGERFTAKGKSVIDLGWKGAAKIGEKKKDDPDDTALGDISSLHEGDEIMITQAGVKAGKTTPPKSYTEDTLLSAIKRRVVMRLRMKQSVKVSVLRRPV